MIDEFTVRERAGVANVKNSAADNAEPAVVTLTEKESYIALQTHTPDFGTIKGVPYLTPNEARKLANQLRRLADRIDKRLDV